MADNIVRLSDVKDNNYLITPRESLLDAINCIDKGEIAPEKSVVILLTSNDEKRGIKDGYAISFFLSNLHYSEATALLEAVKLRLVKTMIGDE